MSAAAASSSGGELVAERATGRARAARLPQAAAVPCEVPDHPIPRDPASPWGAGTPAGVPLPEALAARLASARGIVAPVGVGSNRRGLVDWARASGVLVVNQPPAVENERWMWCPTRRSELMRLGVVAADALVLADDDTTLGMQEWLAALPGHGAADAESSWAACQGWPAALPLARALPGAAALHAHPLAAAILAGCLPPEPLRQAAARLAVAALVTPAVADALQVDQHALHALHDGGWLWHERHGWVFPALLRRLLAPHPALAEARLAADALADDGHEAAALHTLADAAAWDDYALHLARSARASQGEGALRRALALLPAPRRARAPAVYVAGLLARACGDVAAAAALYTQALAAGLPDGLSALVQNARGVVHAMAGDVEPALADFCAAALGTGAVAGEANANRATLLIQLGRHDEAEASLQAAVAAFRASGDTVREARCLGTLGGLRFGRGLLREALPAYAKALDLLLPGHADDAARMHLNLGECKLWLGETDALQQHLAAAAELQAIGNGRGAGWLLRLRALDALHGGDAARALVLLDEVATDDASLRAECALARAAALRALHRGETARQALAEAASLGLRAQLEAALLDGQGLDEAVAAARAQQARLELAQALLRRGSPDDLAEALALVRSHGWVGLLDDPTCAALAPLAAQSQDDDTRALFPLRIRLVGPLQVAFAGRSFTLADFPTRKSAALLVALAVAGKPLAREALADRFWGEAKNPLASLQTALYHLRTTLGASVVSAERGLLGLVFPSHTDAGELQAALRSGDARRRERVLAQVQQPAIVVADLAAELADEGAWAQRQLLDALRAHANALPEGDIRRREALRDLVAVDPLDTDAREALVRWHERRGEAELAEHERRRWRQARQELGLR